jgi:hypothetical protein
MGVHISFILRYILESFNFHGCYSHLNQHLSYNLCLFLNQNFPDCPPTSATDSPSRMQPTDSQYAWRESKAFE